MRLLYPAGLPIRRRHPRLVPSDYVATGDHDLSPYWNSQLAASTWYHDHALGLTRLNVYMGLASGYLMTDPAHEPDGLPAGEDSFGNPMDMALIIQDRMSDQYGELYFPALGLNPTEHPFWIPEFFGDTMLVNGQVWPELDVDPAAYRFRLFNGSNARFDELIGPPRPGHDGILSPEARRQD